MNRRKFLVWACSFAAIRFARAMTYLTTTTLADGTIVQKGLVNGFLFSSKLLTLGQTDTVSVFEINIVCFRMTVVQAVLDAVGLGAKYRRDFQAFPGKSLLVGLADVAGDFLVKLNGQVFLTSVDQQLMHPGQTITITLTPGGVGKLTPSL